MKFHFAHTLASHDTTNLIPHSASGGKFHFVHILKPSFRTLLFLLAAGVFLFSCNEDIKLSSEASLTSLTLTVGSTDYEVTFTGTQYTLGVGSYGTEIPATVGVKDIVLSSGATTDAGNELSVTNNAVTITVTAADGTTRKTHTVRLTAAAGITSFTFEVPGNESMALDTADHKRIVGKIDHEVGTITFARQSAYVYRDKLKATFEASEEGAAVQVAGADQTSGTTEQDFTSSVAYAVRAPGSMEIITYTVTLTKSTRATIPDDPFRAKLKEFVPDAFTGDQLDIMHDDVVNRDGILLVDNPTPKLTSLKGIEFFTALDTLNCRFNALTSLNLSRNTALKDLNCNRNSLTSLNVSKNTVLTRLLCYNNSLQSLDVSGSTALTFLACESNSLTSLDLGRDTALEVLYCGDNDLASLDVSGTTALTELSCGDNDLASLDVSGTTALTELSCGDNDLASLDVRANTALMRLNCGSNGLTSLDLNKNTALTTLDCYGNALTSLDMTGMRSVTRLNLGLGTAENNPLATLRVNTAIQDNTKIVAMKTARGTNLTITTVNNDGKVVCNDYDPANGGNCNQAP